MKITTTCRAVLAFSAVLVAAPLGAATADSPNWPGFRGPNGNGLAPNANPPLTWSETNHIAWKVPVTGRGRSSPIFIGNRIWLTTAVEKNVVRTRIGSDDMQVAEHVSLRVVCLDRTSGKSLWETTLFDVAKPDSVHWLNSWATPTPVAEAGRVYCEFGTFGTACLEADTGKVVWKKQIRCDHQVGPGSSPILWKDRLILVRDGREAQYVIALNKENGEVIWKTDRPPVTANSPNLKKSFSSPLIIEATGKTQVFSAGPHWAVAYDPDSGKELWRVQHGKGFSIGTCPIYGQGLVFFGTGCFKAQLYAVRPDGQGDVTTNQVAWKTLRQVPVMSSPILVGEEIYWIADDGMATCANARTGDIHWQERLGSGCLASPIAAQGRLYFFMKDAKTIVLKAGKQFERLAENVLEGTLIATPAVSDCGFYLRTDTHVYCLE
ncbi:MAG: PQQ-binding-like beta-propeller repeat protein [Verrucomicrobiota bacterium]